MEEQITLCILNITSFTGQCSDASHVYGKLILCNKPEINIDNIEEWNINHIGTKIELHQPLTLKIAKKLDKKDGGHHYEREVRLMIEYPKIGDGLDYWGKTDRFDLFEEVEDFAINEWKKLNLACSFISLYEGEKYDFKDIYTGELCKTKIITKLANDSI